MFSLRDLFWATLRRRAALTLGQRQVSFGPDFELNPRSGDFDQSSPDPTHPAIPAGLDAALESRL